MRQRRPNYTLKPTRPGFGPGLKPLVQRYLVGVTPLSTASEANAASGVPRELRHAGPGRAA